MTVQEYNMYMYYYEFGQEKIVIVFGWASGDNISFIKKRASTVSSNETKTLPAQNRAVLFRS